MNSSAIVRSRGASPRTDARVAGVLWLACIVTGIVSFAAGPALLRGQDAATMAATILANERLFRVGVVADIISGASYVGVTALLFSLLKPSGRSISLVAASFGLVGVAMSGVGFLMHASMLVLVHGQHLFAALTAAQLHDMLVLATKLQALLFSIGMVFFGVQILLAGWLITRSTFLPRALGVLLAVGGTSYVMLSMATLLAPSVGGRLLGLVMPIALIGEGSLTAWLLTKGVDVQRWREQMAGE
jgi:hypothetical protein